MDGDHDIVTHMPNMADLSIEQLRATEVDQDVMDRLLEQVASPRPNIGSGPPGRAD